MPESCETEDRTRADGGPDSPASSRRRNSVDFEGRLRRLVSPSESLAPYRPLVERLAETNERFRATVRRLDEATEQLATSGKPPTYLLFQDLGECNRLFLSLRNEFRIKAHELGHKFPAPESLPDLQSLANHLFSLDPGDSPPKSERGAGPADRAPDPVARETLPEIQTEFPEDIPGQRHDSATDDETPGFTDSDSPIETPPPNLANAAFSDPDVPKPQSYSEPEPPSIASPMSQEARAVLDKVSRLRSVDGRDSEALNACRQRALQLLDTGTGSDDPRRSDEIAAISSGDHPFCSLLTVALASGPMDDADWARDHQRISQELGRELAIAAARARLMLGE